jgi:hypothetical protein
MSTHTATAAPAAHSEYLRHRVRFAPAAASQLLADFFREDRTVQMPRDPQVWTALVEHGDSNTLARAVLTCLQPGELQLVSLDAGLRFDCLDALERHAWALVAEDRAPVLPPDGFPALLAEKVFEPLGLLAEAAALYALGHDDRDASGKPLDRLTRAVMRYRLARSLGRLAQNEPEWRSCALELMESACRACEPKSPERLGSDPTGLRLRLHGYQWLGARWAADGREADARQAFERAIRAAMELGEGELAVALEAFSRYSLGPANDGVPVPTLPSPSRRPSSGSRSSR